MCFGFIQEKFYHVVKSPKRKSRYTLRNDVVKAIKSNDEGNIDKKLATKYLIDMLITFQKILGINEYKKEIIKRN
jgi:hypothetical protein